MTKPPIRTIDEDAARGILESGKPAGLWMYEAKGVPMSWAGIAADGKKSATKSGTFPEVLTWLMIRGGIMPRSGKKPENRNMSRDPEYRYRRESSVGLRVEGAAIREWTAPYVVKEIPSDGWGTNTIKPYQPEPVKPEPKPEPVKPKKARPKPEGRPRGSGLGKTENSKRTDAQIRQMVLDGMDDETIAADIGIKPKTVGARILAMRKEGAFPNDKLPAWRVRRFQRNDEMNRKRRGLS